MDNGHVGLVVKAQSCGVWPDKELIYVQLYVTKRNSLLNPFEIAWVKLLCLPGGLGQGGVFVKLVFCLYVSTHMHVCGISILDGSGSLHWGIIAFAA